MPNEKNLIPFGERTESEQRKIRSAGGKASGEARRKKRDMKRMMKLLLNMPATGNADAFLEQIGVAEEDRTNQAAVLAAVMMKAMSGDVRAAEFVRDTIGASPRQVLEEKRFAAEQESTAGGTNVVNDWINSIPVTGEVIEVDGDPDVEETGDGSGGEETTT